jgi:hypothetical protein
MNTGGDATAAYEQALNTNLQQLETQRASIVR